MWNYDLKAVRIPKNVSYIGAGLIALSSDVESIEVDADNLKYSSGNNENIIIDKANKVVIAGCKNSTIPYGIQRIGTYAFDGCSDLQAIELPTSVTYIEEGAFKGCESLTKMIIPESLTEIEPKILWSCTSLTNVDIPDGVTSIGFRAFAECENLAGITVPASVEDINEDAFEDVPTTMKVVVAPGSKAETFFKSGGYSELIYEGQDENGMSSGDSPEGSDKNPLGSNPVPTGSPVINQTVQKVVPPSVSKIKKCSVKAKKKALSISWKKLKGVSGYEIQISTNKKFKKVKTLQIKKNKVSCTIKKLKSNKKYYVRIRGYKIYQLADGTNKKAYGKYTVTSKKTK